MHVPENAIVADDLEEKKIKFIEGYASTKQPIAEQYIGYNLRLKQSTHEKIKKISQKSGKKIIRLLTDLIEPWCNEEIKKIEIGVKNESS